MFEFEVEYHDTVISLWLNIHLYEESRIYAIVTRNSWASNKYLVSLKVSIELEINKLRMVYNPRCLAHHGYSG